MLIRWDDSAENIYNKIRGLSPYPAAFSRIQFNGNTPRTLSLKILGCEITHTPSTQKPGFMTIVNDKQLLISTKTSDISVKTLQLEGKKPMDVKNFLLGFRHSDYTLILF